MNETIREKLSSIIFKISGISVDDTKKSLFGEPYRVGAEIFVYILLEVSREFDFKISTTFIESLEACNFENLATAIVEQLSICDR